MKNPLLKIENLHASAGEKPIINGINLEVFPGEVHVMMGPNGAGKSTIANVIMGHPTYAVTDGTITFDGENITEEATDARARKGLFLSFQQPEEIQGITVENFLRAAKTAITGEPVKALAFHREIGKIMKELDMDESYAERYLNVGFSGGERKKNEIFQMLVLNPRLAILDETDSGLDVDAVKIVSKGINKYKNKNNAILIITHNTKILDSISPDFVHVLVNGKIVKTGDYSLVNVINEEGFAQFEKN